MAEVGLGGHEFKVWMTNLFAHVLVTAVAYVLLGGLRLKPVASGGATVVTEPFERKHWLTIAVIAAWIAGVVGFKFSVGLAAFLAASVLVLVGLADESAAMKRVPWGVIIMVCGVTVLIAVLEKTGGMDLFTSMLARLASPVTINGVVAFVTGLISSWSSTAGVVLPSFLPTVPGLVEKVGGGDPLAVALSINVGSAMVDVSPLSTLGALCVATVADLAEARVLFRQLLIWGLSMSVVAALLCQLFAGILAGA
jgi:di/tricarboxylate transporter